MNITLIKTIDDLTQVSKVEGMTIDQTKPVSADPARAAPTPKLQSAWPAILEMRGWDDYCLLDSGHGRKLESYGDIVVVRPEEQALWSPRLPDADWDKAQAIFTGDVEEEGPGRWRFPKPVGETWQMAFGPVKFVCRFTSFRHVGVFAEQAAHWSWMADRIRAAKAAGRTPKLLNLFGYTGLASLIAAEAGAQVTHVDASKKAIAWARENQALSGLEALPIRWICEDAMKFVQREVRRGNSYDAIILDPPKYGRGTNGEVWQLFEHLPEMLTLCRELTGPKPMFNILTVYAMRASFISFHELFAEIFGPRGGLLESGELLIEEQFGRKLATSLFCRWQPESTA